MSDGDPRASVITEALRACTVHVVNPHRSDDDGTAWAQLDRKLALLADDLAIAVDDRRHVCRECGAPCPSPPLAELAGLLRPDVPTPTSESDKATRLARVLWVLGNLLGQCERHGFPVEILASKRGPRV